MVEKVIRVLIIWMDGLPATLKQNHCSRSHSSSIFCNVQLSRGGLESPKVAYWVQGYAVKDLRFFVLNVPSERYVVTLITTGPLSDMCSFSFAQTELLSSSLWRSI
jgi:hypothetical protein